MYKVVRKVISIVGVALILTAYVIACSSMHISASTKTGTNNYDRTFTSVDQMSTNDWDNPEELERVWQAALVRIPRAEGMYISSTINSLSAEDLESIQKLPTVIYMHGCSGVWEGTIRRINFLAEHGFVVIAPVSFSRKKYPQSCDPNSKQAGMYRGTLKMRQNDAGYAIAKAKSLSWVDPEHVFLMGLSQGGVTTATFFSKDKRASVKARVVEGWTCQTPWSEYRGIKAPKSEPVLTLVASNDPWFQKPWNSGSCKEFLNKSNGSRSVVFTKGKLSNQHELLENKKVQKIVLTFLNKYTK